MARSPNDWVQFAQTELLSLAREYPSMETVSPKGAIPKGSSPRAIPKGSLEVEARFGHYEGERRNFRPGIRREVWNRLVKHFSNLLPVGQKPRQLHIEDEIQNAIRHSTITDPKRAIPSSTWIRKEAYRVPFDFINDGVRISVNIETPIAPISGFRPDLRRIKDRFSFTIGKSLRLDLTNVRELVGTTLKNQTYEVELELLSYGDNDRSTFTKWIGEIRKLIVGSYLPYSEKDKLFVLGSVNQLLGSNVDLNKISQIETKSLVQPRNLELRDLTWGGLMGNPETAYNVAYKADGIRRLLYISQNAVWLIGLPDEVNKILSFNKGADFGTKSMSILGQNGTSGQNESELGHVGTLLDGELIPMESRLPNSTESKTPLVTSKYWYLAFDCLAFDGDTGIQSLPHRERLTKAQIISDLIKDRHNLEATNAGFIDPKLIKLETKTTYELDIVTEIDGYLPDPSGSPETRMEHYFLTLRRLFERENLLPYRTDGLIFTPTYTPYLSGSAAYPLNERTLSRMPDQCKWKPQNEMTIDWAIFFEGDQIVLLSGGFTQGSSKYGPGLVPFTGIKRFPFDPSTIDLNANPDIDFKYISNGTVISWLWIPNPNFEDSDLTGKLVPITVRYDKDRPNTLEVAKANWRWVNDPITLDTLLGRSFKLVRNYHNRLKEYLLLSASQKGNKFLLDLGSGQGGDVSKWQSYDRIVAVEPNEKYHDELERRIKDANMTNKVKVITAGAQETSKITQAVQDYFGRPADVISLMLSMTFLWDSQENVSALASTIRSNLVPHGSLVFLTFDGDLVTQMFRPAFRGPIVDSLTLRGTPLITQINESNLEQNGTPDQNEYIQQMDLKVVTIKYIEPSTKMKSTKGNKPVVEINFEGSEMVQNQREYLVFLSDLFLTLNGHDSNEFRIVEMNRATTENFLSTDETVYTRMFTYARWVRNPSQQKSIRVQPRTQLAKRTPGNNSTVLTNKPHNPDTIPSLATSPRKPIQQEVFNETITEISPESNLLDTESKTFENAPITLLSPTPDGPIVTSPSQSQEVLSWLIVEPPPKLEDPGIGDDAVETLDIPWYNSQRIIRMASIADGSCFFHSTLKAFHPVYQENRSYKDRTTFVKLFRSSLADYLASPTSIPVTKQILQNRKQWNYLSSSLQNEPFLLQYEVEKFPEIYIEQKQKLILSKEDSTEVGITENTNKITNPEGNPIDFRLQGLIELLKSNQDISQELYEFLSKIYDLTIYILFATSNSIEPYTLYPSTTNNRQAIVILGNGIHYEVIARDQGSYYQTIFPHNDEFISTIQNRSTSQ